MTHFFNFQPFRGGRLLLTLLLGLNWLTAARAQAPSIAVSYSGDPISNASGFTCYVPPIFPVGEFLFTITDNSPRAALQVRAGYITQAGTYPGVAVGGWVGSTNVYRITTAQLRTAGMDFESFGTVYVDVTDPDLNYVDVLEPVAVGVDIFIDVFPPTRVNNDIQLSAQIAGTADPNSLFWSTDGTGTFDDATAAAPTYTPSGLDYGRTLSFALGASPVFSTDFARCGGQDAENFYVAPSTTPTISGFSPASGYVGGTVTLTGTNLDQVTAVDFWSGVPVAGFTANAAGTTLTVPITRAMQSVMQPGVFTVTTAGGDVAASSTDFTVLDRPITITHSYVGQPTSLNDCYPTTYFPTGTHTFTVIDPDLPTADLEITAGFTQLTPGGSTQPVPGTVVGNTFRVTTTALIGAGLYDGQVGELHVMAHDPWVLTSVESFVVTDLARPIALTIDAGSDQLVSVGADAFLNAQIDPYGNPQELEITWYRQFPGDGSFSNPNDPATGYTPDADDLAAGFVDLVCQVSNVAFGSPRLYCSASDVVRINFDVPPTITSFTPTSGPVGTVVTINGQFLGGATDVSFGAATGTGLTVVSGTQIRVTVPVGATSGPFTVFTGAGSAQPAGAFTVTATGNAAPTALGLSPQSVTENTASGTAIGNFSTTDPNAGNTHTYSLVSGTGSTHNAQFSISGGQLRTAAVFDFETQPSRSVRVRTTDQGGLFFERAFTLTVTNANEAPTFAAQTRSIAENSANGTAVGIALAATDPDGGSTLTYSILSGNTGGAFTFGTGGQLRVANVAALDFETMPAFTLTVRVSDGTLTAQNTVTVNLINVVEPPTGLTFFPVAGAPGSVVRVTGTGFTAASSARFNGAAATGTRFVSAAELIATVPGNATSGALTAVTGGTTLTGAGFTVLGGAAPRLTYFTPLKAPVGTTITVAGAGFTGVTGVRFGAVSAPGYVVNSATSLTVPVPTGAVSGSRIYILTGQGMTQSARAFTLILPPTLTLAAPAYGAPGALTVLTGTNLTNASTVTFNGTPAASFTVESATRIVATIPAGATSGPVEVETVAGTANTAFSIVSGPAPTLTTLTPGSGLVGATVVLGGTNLNGATSVRFNATEAVGYVVNSASQITASVPTGATTGKVWVLTPRGLTCSATPFTVVTTAPTAPVISSFAPNYGSPGALVVLTGLRLGGATAVTFGGGVAAASFTATATQLIATVPIGAVTGTISVTTPGGSAITGSAFTISTPAAPAISGFSPGSGPVGTSVTVSGSGFTGVTSVRLNGLAVVPTVPNAGQLSFPVPTGATSGRISILASGGLMRSATDFIVVPAPAITAFSPASGAVGSAVTLTGTNLTGATAVRFNGVSAPVFTVVSATQLTVTVPAGATTGVLSVTTPGGTATSATTFTVVPTPAPTISSISPASGIIGTTVTVSGTHLTGATVVQLNGKPAESYVVTSATSLNVVVSEGTTTGLVSVTTLGGTALSPAPFTVLPTPDIDALAPVRGPVGTVVTLRGTGLSGATGVRFGATAAGTFSAAPDGLTATATVPAGTVAVAQVSLTNAQATATSAQVFTLTLMRPNGVGWVPAVQVVPYPNPAGSAQRLTVQVLNRPQVLGSAAVYLFDALGRRVRSAPLDVATGEAHFELTGLAPGVYIARCGTASARVLVGAGQ